MRRAAAAPPCGMRPVVETTAPSPWDVQVLSTGASRATLSFSAASTLRFPVFDVQFGYRWKGSWKQPSSLATLSVQNHGTTWCHQTRTFGVTVRHVCVGGLKPGARYIFRVRTSAPARSKWSKSSAVATTLATGTQEPEPASEPDSEPEPASEEATAMAERRLGALLASAHALTPRAQAAELRVLMEEASPRSPITTQAEAAAVPTAYQSLTSMGYSTAEADMALRAAEGDLQVAVDLLLLSTPPPVRRSEPRRVLGEETQLEQQAIQATQVAAPVPTAVSALPRRLTEFDGVAVAVRKALPTGLLQLW